jgi:hypothetical protein
MIEHLNKILNQLKKVNVRVSPKTTRKQVNLFDVENIPEIQFNGFPSLSAYQQHIDELYAEYKAFVTAFMVNSANQDHDPSHDLKIKLDDARFELKAFRKRYFPKSHTGTLMSRVEFSRATPSTKMDEATLKQSLLEYFRVELRLLALLDLLFQHHIHHLERFYSPHAIKGLSDSNPSTDELSAHAKGQLSLFPKGSDFTLMQWTRSKVEFIELFTAIYESNAIKPLGQHRLLKKDYFNLLMWFFNINIGHLEGSLSAAKNRKTNKESPYLKELIQVFTNYTFRD